MEILSALSRWIHVLAGIVWIGMLYFFNFVNGPFQGTQDGETKKKVNPELLPRALYWFRMGRGVDLGDRRDPAAARVLPRRHHVRSGRHLGRRGLRA